MSAAARAGSRVVGQNIQHYRSARGVSADELGSAIGVTAREIQRYEGGLDPIGSRRLLQISRVLDVPFASFIDNTEEELVSGHPPATAADEEFDIGVSSGARLTITEMLSTRYASEMLEAFCRIRSVDLRRKLLRVIERVAASAKR